MTGTVPMEVANPVRYDRRRTRHTEPLRGAAHLSVIAPVRHSVFMPGPGGSPASFLAPGCSWMGEQVDFVVPARDPELRSACEAVWQLSASLRAARGRRGLSMSDLAAYAGVRRQTVSDIENGKAWPDVATVARLLRQLGLDLAAVKPESKD